MGTVYAEPMDAPVYLVQVERRIASIWPFHGRVVAEQPPSVRVLNMLPWFFEDDKEMYLVPALYTSYADPVNCSARCTQVPALELIDVPLDVVNDTPLVHTSSCNKPEPK